VAEYLSHIKMIIGEYKQRINEKNRIAFPKKFREELGDALIITKGYEGCLVIMSPDQWEKIIADSTSGPFVSGIVRDTSRFLLASASELQLDSQGRFVVPSFLIDYAEIKVEGTFLGLGRWVELWGNDKWELKKKEVEENSSEVGEKLSKISISDNGGKS